MTKKGHGHSSPLHRNLDPCRIKGNRNPPPPTLGNFFSKNPATLFGGWNNSTRLWPTFVTYLEQNQKQRFVFYYFPSRSTVEGTVGYGRGECWNLKTDWVSNIGFAISAVIHFCKNKNSFFGGPGSCKIKVLDVEWLAQDVIQGREQ